MKINFAALKAALKNIKNIKNIKHKFLFCACLISLILSIATYILCISFSGNIIVLLFSLIVFIPFATTISVYSAAERNFEKHPLITKIVSALINIFTIVCIHTYVSFCALALAGIWDFDFKTFTQKEEYKEALKYLCQSQNAKHFPKEIPEDAKNVRLYKPNDCWFGSEHFSLYLESDRDFIIDSFRGVNCIETEGPYNNKDEYKYHAARNYAVQYVNIEKTNLMFCVIDAYGETEEYGIAVDYKNNRILFYSILLD